eukprot:CAMPEP_0202853814 /NCGR_PEP_ID=MMETSP1389-20130828/90677_1 /ASSEMBLY_ACC=CAM_ASM_000865 /TAXON_ID=302021 /ORGANISM="Rhodomonas sp., Strain CCMP768" /LENGTH=223 /DNA_ID=CAMNT_0049532379 /DNA_START=157 /DNA_END=828 /DNA_ORIENTATION=+
MSELSRSTDSIQADVCAACHSIIEESNGSPVVYGMDHKFCTEGCRCVFFFGQCSSGGGLETQLDDDDMVFRKRCKPPPRCANFLRSTDRVHSIIQESNGSPVRLCLLKLHSRRSNSPSVSLMYQVVYGMDHKFCTEGCRCVFFFGQCSSGGGLETQLDDDDMVFRKRYNAGACPCLHFNATCPHFASFAAGLVRNKWGFNKFVREESLDGSETKEIRLSPAAM